MNLDTIDVHILKLLKENARAKASYISTEVGLSVSSVTERIRKLEESGITNVSRYRSRNIPTAGALLKEEDVPEKQISFDI